MPEKFNKELKIITHEYMREVPEIKSINYPGCDLTPQDKIHWSNRLMKFCITGMIMCWSFKGPNVFLL